MKVDCCASERQSERKLAVASDFGRTAGSYWGLSRPVVVARYVLSASRQTTLECCPLGQARRASGSQKDMAKSFGAVEGQIVGKVSHRRFQLLKPAFCSSLLLSCCFSNSRVTDSHNAVVSKQLVLPPSPSLLTFLSSEPLLLSAPPVTQH